MRSPPSEVRLALKEALVLTPALSKIWRGELKATCVGAIL
jgi:hypothetical protein